VTTDSALLAFLFFAVAVLYSSVGHAGASGYLAAMAFLSVATEVMRPTALVLNVLVATIATVRFYRAGCFSWRTLWPFAATSIPLSFVGGGLTLPSLIYKRIVGAFLLVAAARLAHEASKKATPDGESHAVPLVPVLPALAFGAGIGFLSGLTGTGGGIFLSPLLLFLGWAETRKTSGVSAAFILLNSLAGLAGNIRSLRALPPSIPLWTGAAVVGGLLGTELGAKRLGTKTLRFLLAAVLVTAGLKLILT
jgi:uncharacterized protein